MKRKIKENYKFIIILILFVICFTIKFPYYINAPGGITDMSKKMEINGYESKGSFNLAYVREYKATIPTFLISLFNKNWKVLKQNDVLLNNETNNSYLLRDKILMNESISNAINVAFKYAGKKIDIISTNLYITYIDGKANTNLVVGDIITKINNKSINSKTDITNIINNFFNIFFFLFFLFLFDFFCSCFLYSISSSSFII